MSTTTTPRTRSTKKYKALIAAGLSDDAAMLALDASPFIPVDEPAEVDRVAVLVNAGFTQEQAEKIVAEQDAPKGKKKGGKKAKAEAPAPELTAKEQGESLVAEKGLAFTRGRVYVTTSVIEAQVRVMKTGTPEVVQTSGVGHVSAVLIYREDSGDVAVQNLKKPV